MDFEAKETHLSLLELNLLVKQVLEDNFLEDAWVVAEIAEIKIASSGHCYLELVEKKDERIVARVKANIWNRQFYIIRSEFESATGKDLNKGLKVLLRVAVGFHELYGVSLTVKAIDPTYTLGELEQQKILVRNRLEEEGLTKKNTLLSLPLLPKRIAVISSRQAAGYEDFTSQLLNNSFRYLFEVELFEAVMQGDKAVSSIVTAFEQINATAVNYDCVVLIRGGGASLDLNVFDSYEVSKAAANCKLPVLCGVGHERDKSIVDSVVFLSLKTPTAVASFLIEQFEDFENQLNEFRLDLIDLVRKRILNADQKLKGKGDRVVTLARGYLGRQREQLVLNNIKTKHAVTVFINREQQTINELTALAKNRTKSFLKDHQQVLYQKRIDFERNVRRRLEKEHQQTVHIAQKIKLLDPIEVLKRGYALISDQQDLIIKNKHEMEKGMTLKITMHDGSVSAKIEKL